MWRSVASCFARCVPASHTPGCTFFMSLSKIASFSNVSCTTTACCEALLGM